LLALLFFLPFERIPSYHLAGVNLRLSLLVGIVFLAACAPELWGRRRELIRAPWTWLLGYLTVGVITTIFALSRTRSLKVLVFCAFVFGLAWAVATISPKLSPRALGAALLAGTAVTILFGFYQFFGDLLGLSIHLTGLRPAYTKAVFGFPRIQSTGLEPLYYADYLLVPAALTLVMTVYRRWRYAWFSLIIMTVIWLTLSRGASYALIAILVGVFVAALYSRRYLRAATIVLVALASVGAAVGLIAFGSHFNRGSTHVSASSSIKSFETQSTNTDQGESVEGRTFSRSFGLKLFKEHPVVGIGLGNYGIYGAKDYPERYPNTSGIVNNETVEILAESGILGFAAILGFAVALIRRAGRTIRRALPLRQPDTPTIWTIALALALIGIAIQYQAFSTLYIIHIWVAIGLLIGFTGAGRQATHR
jgi:hypothetical protein